MMKELVYIGGVPLVDLDDCDVTNNKLLYDSFDSDDDVSPNADGARVCNDLRSYSQTMDANVESASKLVSPEVGKHSEPHTTPTTSIDNLFLMQLVRPPIRMLWLSSNRLVGSSCRRRSNKERL